VADTGAAELDSALVAGADLALVMSVCSLFRYQRLGWQLLAHLFVFAMER